MSVDRVGRSGSRKGCLETRQARLGRQVGSAFCLGLFLREVKVVKAGEEAAESGGSLSGGRGQREGGEGRGDTVQILTLFIDFFRSAELLLILSVNMSVIDNSNVCRVCDHGVEC